MIDAGLIAKYFCEALYVVTSPRFIHLPIATELSRHQVMHGLDARQLKTIRQKGHKHFTLYKLLCRCEESLDIAHHRIEVLALM